MKRHVGGGQLLEEEIVERGDMRKTTHGWTVVHSLPDISVTFPTSHAERSPLNCFARSNTEERTSREEEEEEERRV